MRYFDEGIRHRLAALNRAAYEGVVAQDGKLVRRTTGTRTYRIELPPASAGGDRPAPGAVYVKLYRPGLRGIKFLLRPSKPWVEALNLRRLARWGVPAVRAVAIGSRRTWWGLADAFLMTEEWPGGEGLAHYAQQHWPIRGSGPAPFRDFQVAATGPIGPGERENQRQIGRLLAEAVRRMHRRHFYHIDLQWRNVLIRRGPDGRWQISLLDCPRGGWRGTIPGRLHGQVCDLASLDRLGCVYLTRAERLRWLRDYLGAESLGRAGRRLARRVFSYRNRFERRRHARTAHVRDGRAERLTPLGG